MFLGLGWKGKGPAIDLDCSCLGFSKGQRQDGHTIDWTKLSNKAATTKDGKKGSTIKHTGDVLSGDSSSGELKDMERIYVRVGDMPDDIDCIAFEANVYTEGVTFSNIGNAYVRLVNADTNQELARCVLDASCGAFTGSVVQFAKLLRGNGGWALNAAVAGGNTRLKELDPYQASMVVNEASPAEASPAEDASENPMKAPAKGQSLLCPALAVATAGGIAAATAIYMTDDVSKDMFSVGLFENGVDFGSCEMPDFGDMSLPEMDMSGFGETMSGFGEAALDWGEDAGEALANFDYAGAAEGAGDAIGGAAGAAGEWAGSAGDAIGGFDYGGAAEGAGDAIGGAVGAIGDAIGDVDIDIDPDICTQCAAWVTGAVAFVMDLIG